MDFFMNNIIINLISQLALLLILPKRAVPLCG